MARRQAGFTLLEMMVVITVMGTMAALLAPGINEALADARASSAAEDLVRLSRAMRARSQATGLAHLLTFTSDSASAGGLGVITVHEGMNNHCRQTPWRTTITGTVANGHAPVDSLNLAHGNYNPPTGSSSPTAEDNNRQVIRMVASQNEIAVTAIAICYEPSGATWQGPSAAGNVGFAFTRQVQPITFTISRTVNREARGRNRVVRFQPAGIARFTY
jgi:prepilin-type N-terminal cleavage/methylation domain-containing protein